MRRALGAFAASLLMATLVVTAIVIDSDPAAATPVATDDTEYGLLGRVFPDPHACNVLGSPFAKGNVCATDFLQFNQMNQGLDYMESLFPKFVNHHILKDDFRCNAKRAKDESERCNKFRSAGIPLSVDENGETFVRDKRHLHMIRITDERVPNKNKEYFVFPLSIHGIERAGVEGGVRAAEDLATWAACGADLAPDIVDCEGEVTGTEGKPYPILESSPGKSIGALKALRKSVIYFVMPNSDGWVRGERFRDRTPGTSFYQRYNGNGVDLNRDWPTQGFTFRPYTPWSEPESRSFGKVLKKIGPKKDGKPDWAGGIDLHGQLIDRAFSFTLMGAGEHKYNKNQRILQVVKGAWSDAEKRLGYSPLIKPNDAPESDPRIYGVQWGTVWDTIDYTITGGIGDWINNEEIGLGGDGIDNEMSLSHLSNCGIGTCFEPDVEQLHVDGNKSLVYSMVNYTLKPEDTTFRTQGRVGYIHEPGFVKAKKDPLKAPPRFTKFKPQDDIRNQRLNASNDFTYQFKVDGPKKKVYNGGIEVRLTCATSPVSTPCELAEAYLQTKTGKEPGSQGEDDWETVNSYFLQGAGYSATGKALHANLPTPGQWRVVIEGAEGAPEFDADIFFTREKGWPDPGQRAYKVSNMRFWKHLKRFSRPGLERVSISEIKNNNGWKSRYDTIVVTDAVYKNLAGKLKKWVAKQDGNLVLTDQGLKMLDEMGFVDGSISSLLAYAGYINFETADTEPTYGDKLARKVNQKGAAEGGQGETDELDEEENHRHQTYEPVPIGYAIQNAGGGDASHAPVWFVEAAALEASKGKGRAVGTTGDTSNVSLGEIKFKGGSIRFAGALLPDPSDEFDHPFGLANHALTYSGYQLIHNLVSYRK